MYKFYCRLYQKSLKAASYCLPWREPKIIEGPNCIRDLAGLIAGKCIARLLIVTDPGIRKIGLLDPFLDDLQACRIEAAIYDQTVANPSVANVEDGLKMYREHQCEAIVAFGGGSPIDCAKGIAARLARPYKTMGQMRGLLKIRRKTVPIFAVPTTAGTGSEATIAAVITDPSTHEKYAVTDISLIPHYAVLDPVLTQNLPPHITAATGMDALTHAVEAYIGKSNTRTTRQLSEKAASLIFENLLHVFEEGSDLIARENMQKASYYAGLAFTRAYVGYVHAIAHALGGMYGIPHGLANAVILPYVLEAYGECVYRPLANLADHAGITGASYTDAQKAQHFIKAIRDLNKRMDIPEKLEGIDLKDIPVISERASKEANPFYPVPKLMMQDELAEIIEKIRA